MNLREKTREELEAKIRELQNVIAKRGIGAEYLARAERIQRNINLAIILGGVTVAVGLTIWALNHNKNE